MGIKSKLIECINIEHKPDWSMLDDWEILYKTKKNRFIVFDVETTGLNPKKDQILELAAIEVEKFELTGKRFHVYIKPKMSIPEKSTAIHKIEKGRF